jgi:hypothetical protein
MWFQTESFEAFTQRGPDNGYIANFRSYNHYFFRQTPQLKIRNYNGSTSKMNFQRKLKDSPLALDNRNRTATATE